MEERNPMEEQVEKKKIVTNLNQEWENIIKEK